MYKKIKYGLVLLLSLLFLSVFSYSQVKVELTGFGKFNFNLSFSQNVKTDSTYASTFRNFYDEWQPFFFDPILEQKTGIGFGGRIALELTPQFAIEGSIEYAKAELRFNEEDLDALKDLISTIGYTPYTTFADSGGNILRYYLNFVYNFQSSGNLTPYITAGIGMTKFTAGPSIEGNRPGLLEKMDMHYENTSAITFNGGFGVKYYLSNQIGLRFDLRTFYCSPEFKQTFGYSFFGFDLVPEGNWVTQSGSHFDASINVGLVVRM